MHTKKVKKKLYIKYVLPILALISVSNSIKHTQHHVDINHPFLIKFSTFISKHRRPFAYIIRIALTFNMNISNNSVG